MRLPIFASYLSLLACFAFADPAGAENAAQVSPGLPDLAVRVLPRNAACSEAELCRLVIHVLNEGDAPYDGPLSVFLDLHAPAVSPPPSSDGPPCTREDYGKFRCDLADVSLLPGGYATIEPEFLFTATAYDASNACASLRWTPQTLSARNHVLSAAVAASGHSPEELTEAAGIPPGEPSRSRLLAAMVGRWGEGDASSANDKACASIGIVTIKRNVGCRPGEANLNGACTVLAGWCPSNRQHLSAPDRCACPATLPFWNSAAGACEGEAQKLACAAPEADPARSCACPADRPVLNAAKGACVAVEEIVAVQTPPPKPAEPKVEPPPAEPTAAAPVKPAMKPTVDADTSDEIAKTDKLKTEERVPATTTAKSKTPAEPVQVASVEPEKPVTAKRKARNAPVREAARHRCRGLQQWGPYLKRCIPLPIFLMGRLFAPSEAAAACPVGQRLVAGRCRKK